MTATDAEFETGTAAAENDTSIDRELIPVLLVAGFLLLLIPEPVTSALGIALVTVGGGLWVRDMIR